MKNLKKFIICVACVLSLAFAGVANFMPNKTNKAFASIEDATVVSTGADINSAIKELQSQSSILFESIAYMSSEGFDASYSAATYKKELAYEEMMIYLFVGEGNVLYYHGDDENLNGEVFLPEDCSGLFSGLSTVEYIDLSGFNSSFASASSNMFDGCEVLKEVTFGFYSTSLFAELDSFWACEVYKKESGKVFNGDFELNEGDTITLMIKTEPEVEVHDFSYEVSGDNKTITATCANGNCDLDNKEVNVSLIVSNKTYDGNMVSVEVSNKETFENVTGQTVVVEYEGINDTVYSKTTTAPVNAGTYKVSVIVEDVVAYQEFEIEKANAVLVSAPTANDLVFNGNSQTLISAGSVANGTLMYKVGEGSYSADLPSATNADSYRVYYKVVGNDNYNNIDEAYVDVTIAKKEIVIDWCENDFTYNGLAQNVTATYEDVNGDDITLNISLSAEFKNAGEYTATVSFKNGEENYKLPVANTKTYNISKFKVTKPVADDTVFAYTGDSLTYELAESEYYTISNNTKTEVGKYDVSVILKDKSNTEWNDSTTDDLTFEFVINKVEFGAAEDAEGNPNNDVKIESIVGGIDPDAKLVIETVNVSNSAEKERLSDVLSLENNKEIVAAIDIKFVLNSAEVQPDGKVVLKIKVPEAVGNKIFELFHVHTATNAEKLTYTSGQDGYIAVEVENFSEFVFVTAKDVPPVVTTPPTGNTSNLPFIFLGLLGGFAILFLLWFFILKRQKYDIVSKIVVSIFETVAVVLLCKFRGTDAMTYVIVDLVAFVCVDIIYMINTARETKKEEQKSVPENVNA